MLPPSPRGYCERAKKFLLGRMGIADYLEDVRHCRGGLPSQLRASFTMILINIMKMMLYIRNYYRHRLKGLESSQLA